MKTTDHAVFHGALLAFAFVLGLGYGKQPDKVCPKVEGQEVIATSYKDGAHYCNYAVKYGRAVYRRKI